MKFTVVFITVLSISTSWAIKAKLEDPKDKREASVGYPSSGHSANSYQSPSLGHEDASAISIGAGYSVGGSKPSYSFGGQSHGSEGGYQISSEGLPASGHASIQLAPISLQANHGGIVSNDLSQLMNQLSHGINSGAISLQSPSGAGGLYQFAGQSAQGQEISLPQLSYGSPKYQQYSLGEQVGIPTYASGSKGLSSYSSTGPVLFSPSESQNSAGQPGLTYSSQNSGLSFGELQSAQFGDSGHSFPGLSLGNSGHSLSGLSFGNSGHGLSGSIKSSGGHYAIPGKGSFKPSAFLGSSVQSDGGHALSGLSASSYAAPSFAGIQSLSGGHGGLSFAPGSHASSFAGSLGGSVSGFGGGAKSIASSYSPKSHGFGSSLDSLSGFASSGHLASPLGTSYGIPSSSYSTNAHAAASTSPQYYVSKHSFGPGSSSFRAPSSSHSALSSYSSGPKYSYGGSSSRYGSPKDIQGAHSETTYNTIKYSAELKPYVN